MKLDVNVTDHSNSVSNALETKSKTYISSDDSDSSTAMDSEFSDSSDSEYNSESEDSSNGDMKLLRIKNTQFRNWILLFKHSSRYLNVTSLNSLRVYRGHYRQYKNVLIREFVQDLIIHFQMMEMFYEAEMMKLWKKYDLELLKTLNENIPNWFNIHEPTLMQILSIRKVMKIINSKCEKVIHVVDEVVQSIYQKNSKQEMTLEDSIEEECPNLLPIFENEIIPISPLVSAQISSDDSSDSDFTLDLNFDDISNNEVSDISAEKSKRVVVPTLLQDSSKPKKLASVSPAIVATKVKPRADMFEDKPNTFDPKLFSSELNKMDFATKGILLLLF